MHWNRYDPEKYRSQELIDYYVEHLRAFATYRGTERMDEWDDFEERAGPWRDAFTGPVTNPGGDAVTRRGWIRMVEEDEADGPLRKLYDDVRRFSGKVPYVIKAFSLRPRVLSRHTPLYREIMFAEGELSRAEREMIAVVVSRTNGCRY